MPQQFLKEITAGANGEGIFPIHAIFRLLYFLLTLVQRNLLDVVVFRIEGTDADFLHGHIFHPIDAKAIFIIILWSQELLHLCRQRMLLANKLQKTDSVERKTANELLLINISIQISISINLST